MVVMVVMVVMVSLPDQDHADVRAGIDDARCRLEALVIDARERHVEVALGQGIGQAAEHRKEERIGDVLARRLALRDHDGDGAVVLEPQVLCAGVDRVVDRAREFADAIARLVAGERAAVQGP